MKLINIGFGNMVSAGRVVAVVSPDSAPVKRLIKEARERGMLIGILWPQHPCGADHGFRSRGSLGAPAGNGGQPRGRAGEQNNSRGGTVPWRMINICL